MAKKEEKAAVSARLVQERVPANSRMTGLTQESGFSGSSAGENSRLTGLTQAHGFSDSSAGENSRLTGLTQQACGFSDSSASASKRPRRCSEERTEGEGNVATLASQIQSDTLWRSKAAVSARLGDTGSSQDRPERADGRDDPTGAPHAVEPCRRRVDYDAFGLEDPTVAALEEARMAELRAQLTEMDIEETRMAELRARLAEMEFLSDAERYAFALAETEDEYTNSEPSTPSANGSSNESDCDINRDGPANADDLMGVRRAPQQAAPL